MTRRRPLPAALLLLALAWPSPQARAQDQPTQAPDAANEKQAEPQQPAEPPKPTLTVRDLLVLQTDRYGEVANDTFNVATTHFQGVNHSKRHKRGNTSGGYDGGPMPLGLITFEGKISQPSRVRMDLPNEPAFFHAHWPNDAQKGARLIDWFGIQEAGEQQLPEPIKQQPHWLAPLRESEDRLWVRTRDPLRKERFLLYDVSMPYKPSIDLLLDGDTYRVGMIDAEAVRPPLTMVLHNTDAGWSSDTIVGEWTEDKPVIATKPPTAEVRKRAAEVLGPLTELLAERGYNQTEIDAAVGMITQAGIEASSKSLVYVMPEDAIDGHIWLRFKPEPDRVIRTAIVVVNSADPDLGTRLDRLVKQLGSDVWIERERAQQELEQIGQAAIRRVQDLRNSDDPEVAFRARQILNAYDRRRETGP